MRASHVSWNILGLAFPLFIAAITVPNLIETLGQEKFGLLALAWGLVSYASALDLGIGRALTQFCSGLHGKNRLDEVPDVLTTAVLITLVTGFVGSIAISLIALFSDPSWMKLQNVDSSELKYSILLLAIALPAQAISATYRGLNEAFLNFKSISFLRMVLGSINFAGPYVMAYFSTDLHFLILTIVASRIVALFLFRKLAHQCLRKEDISPSAGNYSKFIAGKLFSFGGWMTVSSVISPLLVQSDRFVIAAVMSAAAVSAYVLPYEVVVQSLIVVGAVSSVMFPQLSRMVRAQPEAWKSYFWGCVQKVTLVMAFVCVSMFVILPELLSLWLKNKLGSDSVVVGRILCIGVFANAFGAMFFSLLHAFGETKTTAKIHLLEFPFFLIALSGLTFVHGVKGAAIAWACRMIFDSLIMAFSCRKFFIGTASTKI